MDKIKVVWTRFGVTPGKIAGGTNTKRETTRRLKHLCDFYLFSHEAIYSWYREFGINVKPYCLIKEGIGSYSSIPFLLYCVIKSMFVKADNPVDIIAARNHDIWDLLPAIFLKLKTKAPLIVYIQARALPDWGSRFFTTWLIVWLERILGLILTRMLCNAVIMRNESDISILRKFGIPADKIFVASHGINLEEIQDIKDIKKKIYDCIFFGRITKGKGIYDLIKAWKLISQRLPNARLLVIGPSSNKEIRQLKSSVHAYGLERQVTIQDTIMGTARFKKLKEARVFALPSYVDTFSYSIGEALACGLPVVAYNIPSLMTVWQDAVTFCKKGNIQELARAITTLLESDDLIKVKSEKGREFVTRYTWDKSMGKEYAVMRYVLSGETIEPRTTG